MTSINSLMQSTSSTSSIYGNRNVISGLASGMDTETMIENAVSGYKTKITGLQQKQEQVQWKQEAYRSIIDKMVSLTRKYTSYTSSTNLFSQSFFNKAVTSVTNGANKDLISATGKTSSDIQINGVKQLAQAARRSVGLSATALAGSAGRLTADQRLQISGSAALDLTGTMDVGKLSGGMTLKYGGSSVYLNFDETDVYKNGQELADAINEKLKDAQVKTGSGSYVAASDRINAKYDAVSKTIAFEDKANAGNKIAITSASSAIESALGFKAGDDVTSLHTGGDKLYDTVDKAEYLSGKEISFTLDGVTKTVKLGELTKETKPAEVAKDLKDKLAQQFGAGKVNVTADKNGVLQFDVANGSTLAVKSDVGEALGLGKSGSVSTYLDTSKTLKELGVSGLFDGSSTQEATINLSDLIKLSADSIGKDNATNKEKITLTIGEGDSAQKIDLDLGEMKYTTTAAEMADRFNKALEKAGVKDIEVKADGSKLNFVSENADTKFSISSSDPTKADIQVESKKMQELTVNGTSVGKFSEDATLTSVMNAINSSDTGVKISYSKLTNEFSMTAKDTGANSKVEMSGKLAEMFGFGTEADKEMGVFDRFEKDPLSFLGVDTKDWTPSSSGDIKTWQDAAGKDVAMQFTADNGDVYLMKANDLNGYKAVAKMTTDKDGNKVLELLDADEKVTESYRQVQSKDGSVSVQKSNGEGAWQTLGTETKGQDAIFTATVNGTQMEMTRSSNTVDMDGMSVTLKGAFGDYNTDDGKLKPGSAEAVTFTTSADTDTIVDAIKSFVNDYNEMVKEIHDAYSTQPNEKSSTDHSRYLPLTEEDRKTMSESAIEAYEEKAKQGILFGSSELSNLYRQLTSVIQNSSYSGGGLRSIGISTSYSGGLTTLELDENALKEALANNPDKVRDVFAKGSEEGTGEDGLMYKMKNVLDAYASTSSGSMGILIQQAGSAFSPSSVNSNQLQKQYDEYTKQIEKWQTKMSDKVDYYTRQFTALEQLIAQMNNQSSMLAGLQGGY